MKKKRVILSYLVILLFFVFNISVFAIFEQSTQSDFDQGNYTNTVHNGSGVVLSGSLTGAYTSKIFDAGNDASWNNLTWQGNMFVVDFLFGIDGVADLWQSVDSGTSWTLTKDDYNGGDGNGVTEMVKNSSASLFVLFNQDIWFSNDKGTTWTKANDDYNGAEGQNGWVLGIDRNNNLFIIEGDQDVWKSSDSGTSWTKASTDFNGGNGNIFGIAVNSSNVIFVVDGAADIWQSSDSGTTWSLTKDDYNGANANDATDMVINTSDSLFILHSQDVWSSVDNGATWTLVNDDFNGAGDSNNGIVMAVDSNNYIYIADGSEDIYRSTDSGQTFSLLVSNMNGANGNVLAMASLIDYTNLTFQARNCSSSDCSDASFSDVDLNNMNLTGGRYFQYNVSFSSPDSSSTPILESVSIDYTILNLAPAVSIVSPQEGTIYSYENNITLNYTASDDNNNLDSCWYNINDGNNITLTNCENTTFNAAGNGNYILNLYVNDSYNLATNDSKSFSILNLAPAVSIVAPQTGATYGYNESLALDFTASDDNNNIDSCWYALNNGNNATLENCQNTTFNVSEGSQELVIYANDSSGNQGTSSISFSVNVGAPTIVLNSPIDVYLNYQNIEFKYTPTDTDLDSCELWGDFTGNFGLNQTNSAISGAENTFSLSLGDGTYLWNIRCNDTQEHSANNGNKTFYVDTINPGLSLSQPTGIKSSRTITASWNINETNADSCWYNVYRGESIEAANTSIDCSLNSTSFSVTVDADFIFNFYVNDSAGNLNSSSSSFSVSTASPPPSGGGGGGGGGGGESITTIITSNASATTSVEINPIKNLIMNPKESKKMSLIVKNSGTSFLNDCKIKGLGEKAGWINSDEIKDLNVGEIYEFIFTLNIPEITKTGLYNPEINLECVGFKSSTSFSVEIIEKKLGIQLKEIKRGADDEIKVSYSLIELAGKEQNVNIEIVLFGSNNERLSEIKETRILQAGTKQDFESALKIPAFLKGNFNLLINANSEIASSFVQEEIILGNPSVLGGFSILLNNPKASSYLNIILIALFLGFSFLIIKRISRFRRLVRRGVSVRKV